MALTNFSITQQGPFAVFTQSTDTQPALTIKNLGSGAALLVNGTTIIDANGNIVSPISDTSPVTIAVSSASPALTITNAGSGTGINVGSGGFIVDKSGNITAVGTITGTGITSISVNSASPALTLANAGSGTTISAASGGFVVDKNGNLVILGSFSSFQIENNNATQFAGPAFYLYNPISSMGNQAGVFFYAGINDAGISHGYLALEQTAYTGGSSTQHIGLWDLNAQLFTNYFSTVMNTGTIITQDHGSGTLSANAVTINHAYMEITTPSLSTAAGAATATQTVTNSVVTASSKIVFSVEALGATAGVLFPKIGTISGGSFTFTLVNVGGAAANGTYLVKATVI